MLHTTQKGNYIDSEKNIKKNIKDIIQYLNLEDIKSLKEDYRQFGDGNYILENDFLRELLDNSNVYFGITTTIWNENIPYDRDEEISSESLLEYIEKHDDMFDYLQDCLKDRFWEVA